MDTFRIVITGRFYGQLINCMVKVQADCGRLAIQKAASVSSVHLVWHNKNIQFYGIKPDVIDYHILQERELI